MKLLEILPVDNLRKILCTVIMQRKRAWQLVTASYSGRPIVTSWYAKKKGWP